MQDLADRIRACRLCAARFAATETHHSPRPVAWFAPEATILVAGQAPGMRVHETGLPFNDASGDRLRDWMGVDRDTFYDRARIAIVPMAFCFPGYRKGSDLPPPPICAQTWHGEVIASLVNIRLTLSIGGYAHRYHLGRRDRVRDIVADWRADAPRRFPLPHPSWRNTGWLRKNPWFEEDVLPELRGAVRQALGRKALE